VKKRGAASALFFDERLVAQFDPRGRLQVEAEAYQLRRCPSALSGRRALVAKRLQPNAFCAIISALLERQKYDGHGRFSFSRRT
jgi:hypothetical protein